MSSTVFRPAAPARGRAPLLSAVAAVAAALALGACAHLPSPPVASARPVAAAASSAASAPAARPDPTAPKPFAEVAKGAQRQDGLVPVWRKDDQVWLEIAPELLGKPLLVSVNVAQSVGERGLYGSQMGPDWLAEFRLVGKRVQLVARQVEFRGERDPALRFAVGQAFSDSLIGSSAVASAPHPERKSVLVDAGFLLGDMAGYSTRLEAAFRMPFAPDRANSYFETTRAEPGMTTLEAKVHFAVPRIAAPPRAIPGAPPPPPPVAPPQTTPDARSLFVGFVYNFRALPAQPMAPRRADPRLGHFLDSYTDLSDDLLPNNRVNVIRRWRLEQKNPGAAVSEPVQPITFWLDRNIPRRYRASVQAGVLEWNKAFERIGFRDAIVVRQQGDDDAFDTLDAGHASIRWFVGADVGFATGPSHSDPRSGEILDADIGMSDVFGRGARRTIREDLHDTQSESTQPAWTAGRHAAHGADAACTYAHEAATELDFALDLLEARGDLDPDSPEAEAFVQAYIKHTIMHEVGHTLGLRHNFKASTVVDAQQLADHATGSARGVSGSVMDYNPFNLPLAGEPPRQPNMTTLGPYDYWAIEYAYKPLDPATEQQELQAIAARSASDPQLAFGDDGDAGGFGGTPGLDPLANRFDLGEDPLAYYQRRMKLSQELWQRVQERGARPGDDPERLRRSLLAGFRQFRNLPSLAAKYVGGMYTSRDPQGSGGQPAFRPVEPERQRRALAFLTEGLLRVDSFRFRPEFLASLSPNYVDYRRAGPFSVGEAVLRLQTQALDGLMSPGTAQRLLELPNYLGERERRGAITLSEVYRTLQDAIWSELKSAREIDPLRRALQREHLQRVQRLLTRPAGALPADALSLARLHAGELKAQLAAAVARKDVTVENRAHLEDALALLTEALRATLQRS